MKLQARDPLDDLADETLGRAERMLLRRKRFRIADDPPARLDIPVPPLIRDPRRRLPDLNVHRSALEAMRQIGDPHPQISGMLAKVA